MGSYKMLRMNWADRPSNTLNSNVVYTCQQQYLDLCQSHFPTVIHTYAIQQITRCFWCVEMKCLNWWLNMTCGVAFVTELAVQDHFQSHHDRNTMACNRQLHIRTNNVTTKTWNFQLFKDSAVNKKSDWQSLVILLCTNKMSITQTFKEKIWTSN